LRNKTQDASPVLRLHLEISQYPILARKIRQRMRQELFARGVVSPQALEKEVKEKAILSQKREGLTNPIVQEPVEVWEERVRQIRDHLTDFYFAYNLPHSLFEEIVREVIATQAPTHDVVLSVHPELAPMDMLLVQGEEFESYPPEKRAKVQHHLEEIIVVLIKSMISDHLDFVGVAKKILSVADLKEIRRRRIGEGKIGGKAAGMILAWKILQLEDPADEVSLKGRVNIPDSYFIGADVFYDFMAINRLVRFHNQKYKSQEQIEADYPQVQRAFIKGRFPEEIIYQLQELLEQVNHAPLIVRSSSLLEDSFGTSFAGKYESFFCPNQGTPEENLQALLKAIARVYASIFGPDAIFYRRSMGLIDYDERMAILIQRVQGTHKGRFFFPDLAGVGFSRNPFRWNRRIRREDGFLRLVWGLGTRAVERVANDYPRMIALSHPTLRPEKTAQEIRKYSQHFVDLLDLEDNVFTTLPVKQVLTTDYPALHLIASQDRGDYVQPIISTVGLSSQELVLTFERLLRETDFVPLMRAILKKLERHYRYPVDIEFAIDIEVGEENIQPRFHVHLLQCRPLSSHDWMQTSRIPEGIPEEDKIFSARRMVPQGRVSGIHYIIYVDPDEYARIQDPATRTAVARVVGHLNKRLEGECFILMGPGRWGSTNPELGVKVSYADIYNTAILIEIARASGGDTPEVSFGTHFFQDLVEANIYPLPLYPDEEGVIFNEAFFRESPNALPELLPKDAAYARYIKVIDVPAVSNGRYLEVVMDGERDEALGYLKSG